jgi:Tol biopolymer transport system component
MPHSRRLAALLAVMLSDPLPTAARAQGTFTLPQVLSYAFPSELAAASRGATIVYALNQEGHRNLWVASAPDWRARRITTYDKDDGEELTSVQLTPDGATVVYARGGDHDSNWAAEGGLAPNPSHSAATPGVRIYTVSASGGTPKMIAEGDQPLLSPDGKRVAFSKGNQIWIVPTDGSSEAKQLFFARGESSDAVWSPDGSKLAFVSSRGDHSFIGVFTSDSTPIRYLAPSTSRDASPPGRPTARTSPSCASPASAARRRRCSTCTRSPGRSGRPTSRLVKDASRGRARRPSRDRSPRPTAARTCTGRLAIDSSS